MKNKYFKSFISSAISIIPMVAIVFVLSLTGLATISNDDYIMLAIGAVIMIVGLSLFQIGAQNSLIKGGIVDTKGLAIVGSQAKTAKSKVKSWL